MERLVCWGGGYKNRGILLLDRLGGGATHALTHAGVVRVSILDSLDGEDSYVQQPQGYDCGFPQQQQQQDYGQLPGGHSSQGLNSMSNTPFSVVGHYNIPFLTSSPPPNTVKSRWLKAPPTLLACSFPSALVLSPGILARAPLPLVLADVQSPSALRRLFLLLRWLRTPSAQSSCACHRPLRGCCPLVLWFPS